MRAGDEEVGAEALLLLGTAQQELRNEISYGVAAADTVDQASRAWLQLLGHIMGTGDDAALIDQLLTAAEAAAASVNAAADNPVLLHLRTLHVLLRQHGAPAAAAAAAALLAACGASQATCLACGRACLTTSKVEADSSFTCESSVALFPRLSCPSPVDAAAAPALTQPTSSAEPKRRRTGNGGNGQDAVPLQSAGTPLQVVGKRDAGPHAPVTPCSEAAPVHVCAAKQPEEGVPQAGVTAAAIAQLPAAGEPPITRASRSRARRAQKEGQPSPGAGTTNAAAPDSAPASAGAPQIAALDAGATVDSGSAPARAVSGGISQAAIGTAQPLLIRIKQDTGDGSGQPQTTLPILPLSAGAPAGGTAVGGADSKAAKAAGGGGGIASAQLRRSGRSTRKEGKAAGGSGGSSPATTPPAPPSGPPAAIGGVSRTVTSLSHGGRPAGPAISSPRELQIALSPYRAVITSGNAPLPPGRRVQKASSDTALGRRSAATRSSTSPIMPDGALALLQSAAEQAYRRTASDPTNFASGSAAAAVAAIAAEARPKQTVSTGAPASALPTGGVMQRPPPSNTVSTGAAPPAASMDMVAAALGLVPSPSAALLDSVAAMPSTAMASMDANPPAALSQAATRQQAPAAASQSGADELVCSAPPVGLPSNVAAEPAAAEPTAPKVVVVEGLSDPKAYLLNSEQEPVSDAAPVAAQMVTEGPPDRHLSLAASQQEPTVSAVPAAAEMTTEGAEGRQGDELAGKADPDVLQSEL